MVVNASRIKRDKLHHFERHDMAAPVVRQSSRVKRVKGRCATVEPGYV
jgi:hypothetical protein